MQEPSDMACSLLLGLAPELRNKIYRFAPLELAHIVMARQRPTQPALLRLSRQIRKETVGIWCSENAFELSMADMDIAPMIHFHRLTDKYCSEGIKNVWYTMHGRRRWANLLWALKTLHAILLSIFWVPSTVGEPWNTARRGMKIVEEFRDAEWTSVEMVLKGFHYGLQTEYGDWV